MAKVIALVGTAWTSRLDANKEPDEVERWGLGGAYTFLNRIDRWFEMHDFSWLVRRSGTAYFRYQAFLQNLKSPVYMLYPLPTISTATIYPLERIGEFFFGEEQPYFSSTIAYMLAMAILEEPDEIKFYGIDMASDMERGHQRDGLEYFIGWARASGIIVTIPDSSPIMKAPLYGQIRDHEEILEDLEAREAELEKKVRPIQDEIATVRASIHREGTDMTQDTISERLAQLEVQERRLSDTLVALRAQIEENKRWRSQEMGLVLTEKIPQGHLVQVNGRKATTDVPDKAEVPA